MPQMQDPNFARTVVLLCDYRPDGAFGLVLNRPTDAGQRHGQAGAAGRARQRTALCIGGPVEPERGWILLADPPEEPEFRTIHDGLYLSTSPVCCGGARDVARAARARARRLRRMGPGQLDDELAQSAWLIGEIDVDLIFDIEPRRCGRPPSAAWAPIRPRCR